MKKNKKYLLFGIIIGVVFVVGVLIGALKMTESSTATEKPTTEQKVKKEVIIIDNGVKEAEERRKREEAHLEKIRNMKFD
ncbi:MAG: hypothetical protein KGV44_04315 [Flavobacteriaceae bacterium]|nr:hypothetical protein [Flavobacteriaceae bacterium]